MSKAILAFLLAAGFSTGAMAAEFKATSSINNAL